LGADQVIDYTQADFTKNGEIYEVIFDTVGKISVASCLKSLKKKGVLILGASLLSQMLQGVWASMTSTKKIIAGVISHQAEDIIFLQKLLETNQMKAVIDQTYSLAQMAEAHAYVEKGHKKGNVAIEVNAM
jgi:NADPH:quinone reductase-like Zn-dependent oxidoreductase